MDLYMTHVAMAANVDDLKIAFANILHKPPFLLDPPLNFDVFLFGRYDPRRGKSGILNLPTAEAGAIFLNAYGSSGVIAQFISNSAKTQLAELGLLSSSPLHGKTRWNCRGRGRD